MPEWLIRFPARPPAQIPAFAGKCWNTSVPYYSWSECDGAAYPGACIISDWQLVSWRLAYPAACAERRRRLACGCTVAGHSCGTSSAVGSLSTLSTHQLLPAVLYATSHHASRTTSPALQQQANAEWMVIGQLLCTGGYPSPLPEGGDTTPPPGNITLVLTNQCSQVRLGGEGGGVRLTA